MKRSRPSPRPLAFHPVGLACAPHTSSINRHIPVHNRPGANSNPSGQFLAADDVNVSIDQSVALYNCTTVDDGVCTTESIDSASFIRSTRCSTASLPARSSSVLRGSLVDPNLTGMKAPIVICYTLDPGSFRYRQPWHCSEDTLPLPLLSEEGTLTFFSVGESGRGAPFQCPLEVPTLR